MCVYLIRYDRKEAADNFQVLLFLENKLIICTQNMHMRRVSILSLRLKIIGLILVLLQEKCFNKNVKFHKLQNDARNFEINGLLKKLLTKKKTGFGKTFLMQYLLYLTRIFFCKIQLYNTKYAFIFHQTVKRRCYRIFVAVLLLVVLAEG